MEQVVLPREIAQGISHGESLAKYGRNGGPSDSELEHENEYRVEYGIGNHREKGEPHRQLGIAGGTYHAVQSEIQVGDYVAQEDYEHVVPGETYRIVAGSEEVEDPVQERKAQEDEEQAGYAVEGDYVGQHLVGTLVVLLAKEYGDQRGTSYPDQGAEGGSQVHQREAYREAGQCKRTDSRNVPDEHAVHHIIQRRRSHGYDARDCVLLKQLAYSFAAKFGGSRVRLSHFTLLFLIIDYLYFKHDRGETRDGTAASAVTVSQFRVEGTNSFLVRFHVGQAV